MMMKIDKRLRASSNDVAERFNSPGSVSGSREYYSKPMIGLKSKDRVGGLSLSTSLAPTPKRTLNNFY